MPVPFCYICESKPTEKQRYGENGLESGEYCPICYQPTCRHHLGTVRWRWKRDGRLDSALVCLDCKKTYRHRNWDPVHRDWIS